MSASHTCVDPTKQSRWEPTGLLYCKSADSCYSGGRPCTAAQAEAQAMQSDKYIGIYDANCDNHEGGDGMYKLCKKTSAGKPFGPSIRGCVWKRPPSPCKTSTMWGQDKDGVAMKMPCANGGVCADKSTTAFACKCKDGFFGATCLRRARCTSAAKSANPTCVNGGVCTDAYSQTVQPAMFACAKNSGKVIAGRCSKHIPKTCSKDDKDVMLIRGAGACWKMNSHKMAANSDATDWIKDSAGKDFTTLCEDECMCLCKSTKGCKAFDYRQTNKECRMQKRVTGTSNTDCRCTSAPCSPPCSPPCSS